MKFEPMNDRVLVLPETKETKAGAIYLPEQSQKDGSLGKVVAKGPKAEQVAVGDAVALPQFGGADVKLEGRTYRLIREEEILGVLK